MSKRLSTGTPIHDINLSPKFTMSATTETRPAGQKKTFGKSTREVPHHSAKAKKWVNTKTRRCIILIDSSRWYPAEDEVVKKTVSDPILETGTLSCVEYSRMKETGVCDRNCILQHLRSSVTHLQQPMAAFMEIRTNIFTLGPQIHPSLHSPRIPCPRCRPYPPCWSFPWQACCSLEEPSPRCPSRYWSIQGQRCSSPQS